MGKVVFWLGNDIDGGKPLPLVEHSVALFDRYYETDWLKNATGVSSSTIAKLGKNQPISMESMIKTCTVLGCDIGDIVQLVGE